MSLFYIVDGYNVINRSGLFRNKRLREQREAFLAFLDHNKPFGSTRNRAVIVFDGSEDVFGFPHASVFEVRFSKGETADEEIKRLVEASNNPKNTVVVTDDRELGRAVRSRGAKIMRTDEFLNKRVQEGKGRPGVSGTDTKAELNIVQRESITEELRKIWLNKRSS